MWKNRRSNVNLFSKELQGTSRSVSCHLSPYRDGNLESEGEQRTPCRIKYVQSWFADQSLTGSLVWTVSACTNNDRGCNKVTGKRDRLAKAPQGFDPEASSTLGPPKRSFARGLCVLRYKCMPGDASSVIVHRASCMVDRAFGQSELCLHGDDLDDSIHSYATYPILHTMTPFSSGLSVRFDGAHPPPRSIDNT